MHHHHHHSHFSSLLFLTIFCGVVRITSSAEIEIHNASELVEFSDNVNSGTSYSGTTVLLDSDIVFSEELSNKFKPTGSYSNNFKGIFDGKGHVISNLTMNSTSPSVGLFGYSHGPITIKNIVIGSSCSFSNSHDSTDNFYVGSIIGYCGTSNGPCIIDSIVNMANITFAGSSPTYSFVGGIIGQVYDKNDHESTIKNCINYGPITYSGYSGISPMIGGIVGECYGEYILNCFNYGVITSNGTSNDDISIIGGITSKTWNSTIENCVSAGEIASNSTNNNIGAIAGFTSANCVTNITRCYWTDDVGYSEAWGKNESVVEIADSYQTEINSSFVEELNSYVQGNQKWLLNADKDTVTFMINGKEVLSTTSQLVLTPSIVEATGYTFNGWYSDLYHLNEFTSYEIPGNITLYARYTNIYNLTFVSDGKVVQIQEVEYDDNVTYPDDQTKTGHIFIGWDIEIDSMPARDITINAIFVINNYTLTLDFDNGTVIEKKYQFNETVELPKDVDKEGYIFNGWNDTIETMPGYNAAVKALWNETSEYVEIVFNTKDMTKEDIKLIIEKYVDTDFEIVILDSDQSSGKMKVIIKFISPEAGKVFVKRLSEDSTNNDLIQRIDFVDFDTSYSQVLYPLAASFIYAFF